MHSYESQMERHHRPGQRLIHPGEAWADTESYYYGPDESRPETSEDAAGWAALGFEILSKTIGVFSSGDVQIQRPGGRVGVVIQGKKPSGLRWHHSSRSIFRHRLKTLAGIEVVNVNLVATIRYNGPEVLVDFGFPAGQRRARLGRDVKIEIRNPLPYKTTPASSAWRAVGVQRYPVIEIPVEIMVDDIWPNPNHNESFSLILSGNKGFGATGTRTIVKRRVVSN